MEGVVLALSVLKTFEVEKVPASLSFKREGGSSDQSCSRCVADCRGEKVPPPSRPRVVATAGTTLHCTAL